MKRKIINECLALIYQFVCVPLLAIISLNFYSKMVLLLNSSGSYLILFLILAVIIILNIAAIYGIVYLLKEVFNMPLINHILTGLVTMFILIWVYVYFITLTNTSCKEVSLSAIDCSQNILGSKAVMTALVVVIAYFFLYIVMQKIVQKKVEEK